MTSARSPAAAPSRLLYVGDLAEGSTSRMRCEALKALGFDVLECPTDPVEAGWAWRWRNKAANRLRVPLDHGRANHVIRDNARKVDVLWLDKANTIRASTLRRARNENAALRIIGFSADDMAQAHCASRYFWASLGYYDGFITTKSFGVSDLNALGCGNVVFVANSFDPATHVAPGGAQPVPKTIVVGFIGYHDPLMSRTIAAVCEAGFPVTVSGPGWRERCRRLPANARCLPPVMGRAYTARIHETLINLGFLRKCNRDLQTTRSVEIPACAGFMLAERTEEHRSLFEEGAEADYYDDVDELIAKIRHYAAHESLCWEIGMNGFRRTRRDRYSYAQRLSDAIERLGFAAPAVADSARRVDPSRASARSPLPGFEE